MSRLVPALVAVLFAGCGLIDLDVTAFDLRLPEKAFTVDTAAWQVQGMGTIPAVPCPPADCAASTAELCAGAACSVACGAAGTCEATVSMSMRHMFDLAQESAELSVVDDKPLIEVTVETIAFKVTENTLNVATPELTVYLAPIDVTDASDERAEPVGLIPSMQGGEVGTFTVGFTATGRDVLELYMGNFRTAFNVIVGGKTTIAAGTLVPMGKLVGAVTVEAHVAP
ncbi:MAG: hypothetical protein EXR73_02135 [Myxococcales bacterium]|nr:hypothetical protein [Myxococcales bacterium]